MTGNDVANVETVELDAYVGLLEAHKNAKAQIKYWGGKVEEYEQKIAAILGDSEKGTVHGKVVLTYQRVDRLRGAALKAAHPDLYEVYTDEVTRREFNVASFKFARPDLYEEFQSRAMVSKF